MTEDKVKDLGFELIKSYDHDQFHTNRYQLRKVQIEFTYEGNELLAVDLDIEEINGLMLKYDQLKQLIQLLP